MIHPELRQFAMSLGIHNMGGADTAELVRAIQRVLGHRPCFGASPFACGEEGCAWRNACLEEHTARTPLAEITQPRIEHHCYGTLVVGPAPHHQ